MKKKLLGILLSTAMVAAMLAGCGKPAEEAPADTAAATEEAPAEEEAPADEAPAEEEAAAPTVDGALVYWSRWDAGSPQATAIQEAIDAYTAETGIEVSVEWKGRDISKIIQASLEAGEKIDLFDEDFQRIAQQYAKDLMDLEDMAAAADYASHSVEALPTAIRGWAGSLKGIAYQPYTSGVFYNKAIFAEAGVTKEPATWAEFLDACQKIKDAGYAPLAIDDAYVLYNYGFQLARYIGQDAVKELCVNGGWADSEEALMAAQDMADLVEKGYLEAAAPGAYPASENTIGFEETAMVVNASWVPGEITNNTQCDLEWGMFNYPAVDGGKDPATIANVGAQAFAIPSYSENGQAAFDLIMKITTGEFDQKIALATDSIPADPTNTEWPPMIAGCKDGFNALTNVYDWNMGLNEDSDLQPIIQENILKVFEGSLDAQGFIAAVDAASK